MILEGVNVFRINFHMPIEGKENSGQYKKTREEFESYSNFTDYKVQNYVAS
jgi:hypothetical protein